MAEKGSIILDKRTLGNTVDEYAGGSFVYSEGIDCTSSTKSFKLGPSLLRKGINSRTNGLLISSIYSPNSTKGSEFYFTADGYLEELNTYSELASQSFIGGGIYRNGDLSYINGIRVGDQFVGIKNGNIDRLTTMTNLRGSTQIVQNPGITSNTSWTVGAGWTTGAGGAVHSSGTAVLSQTLTTIGSSILHRVTVKVEGCTTGSVVVKWGAVTLGTIDSTRNVWNLFVSTSIATSEVISFTPTTSFNGTISYVSVFEYDMAKLLPNNLAITSASEHPVLLDGPFLYIGCGNTVEVINTSGSTWTKETYPLLNIAYSIVSMTQVGGSIILWAWDGQKSIQAFRGGVGSELISESVLWDGMQITSAVNDEVKNYVMVSGRGNNPRLYVVSGYTRQLLSRNWYDGTSLGRLNPYYVPSKIHNYYTYNNNCMAVLNDELMVGGYGGIHKYGSKIPGVNDCWSKDIVNEYNTVIHSMMTFNGIMTFGHKTSAGVNTSSRIREHLFRGSGYLVSAPILWDAISSKKGITKFKFGFKNLSENYGNIKVSIIVDDVYFRTEHVTGVTVTPTVGSIYNVGTYHKAEVVSTDITAGVGTILLKSTEIILYSPTYILTNITKVSGTGDNTILTTGFTNSALIKTIESTEQGYNYEFIFGSDFITQQIPYRRKLNFVIELNTFNTNVSPEVYDIEILSSIVSENA